jgi:hypothetical protein
MDTLNSCIIYYQLFSDGLTTCYICNISQFQVILVKRRCLKEVSEMYLLRFQG